MTEMKEVTILSDLATTNPNQPATNGLVLLLRAETQSEFRTLRTEMKTEFALVRSECKAEIRSEVGSLRTEMNQKFDEVNQKFDEVGRKFDDVNLKLASLSNSVELIAQQTAALLLKS